MKFLSEGTVTVLFGNHCIIHSIYVVKAWKLIYGSYPAFWKFVCIFIHDIGYFGKNYISDKSNDGHGELGAKIAGVLFGRKGFHFVAGHTRATAKKYGLPLSELEPPDDYSWILAPDWFLKWGSFVENTKLSGLEWRKLIIKNWEERGMFNRGSSFDMSINNDKR